MVSASAVQLSITRDLPTQARAGESVAFSELAGQKLAIAGRRRRDVQVYPQSDNRERWLQVNDRPPAFPRHRPRGMPRRRHMTRTQLEKFSFLPAQVGKRECGWGDKRLVVAAVMK